jgi:hypothetical protein
MNKFNTQFATQKLRQETSMTSAGATFTPGTGEQTAPRATKKVVKKKVKKEGTNIPKDFTDAPSIPNRPSKAFVYKQLYEELSKALKEDQDHLDIDDRVKVVYGNQFYGETGTITDIKRGFVTVEMDINGEEYSMHSSDVEKIEDGDKEVDDFYDDNYDEDEDDEPVTDYGRYRKDPESYEKDYQEKGTSDYFQRRSLDENYSKFKTETKTRGKSDQFHQAIREVKKKVLEINKMYEYVSRLKEELSEGEEGLKYKMQTEKALHKIKEMVSELNKKIKRFK